MLCADWDGWHRHSREPRVVMSPPTDSVRMRAVSVGTVKASFEFSSRAVRRSLKRRSRRGPLLIQRSAKGCGGADVGGANPGAISSRRVRDPGHLSFDHHLRDPICIRQKPFHGKSRAHRMAVVRCVSGVLLGVDVIEATNLSLGCIRSRASAEAGIISEVQSEQGRECDSGIGIDKVDRVAETTALKVVDQQY
jgi:hypothetical protein